LYNQIMAKELFCDPNFEGQDVLSQIQAITFKLNEGNFYGRLKEDDEYKNLKKFEPVKYHEAKSSMGQLVVVLRNDAVIGVGYPPAQADNSHLPYYHQVDVHDARVIPFQLRYANHYAAQLRTDEHSEPVHWANPLLKSVAYHIPYFVKLGVDEGFVTRRGLASSYWETDLMDRRKHFLMAFQDHFLVNAQIFRERMEWAINKNIKIRNIDMLIDEGEYTDPFTYEFRINWETFTEDSEWGKNHKNDEVLLRRPNGQIVLNEKFLERGGEKALIDAFTAKCFIRWQEAEIDETLAERLYRDRAIEYVEGAFAPAGKVRVRTLVPVFRETPFTKHELRTEEIYNHPDHFANFIGVRNSNLLFNLCEQPAWPQTSREAARGQPHRGGNVESSRRFNLAEGTKRFFEMLVLFEDDVDKIVHKWYEYYGPQDPQSDLIPALAHVVLTISEIKENATLEWLFGKPPWEEREERFATLRARGESLSPDSEDGFEM
ncbi:MAG: hypothetical protein KDD42_06805, partial [Bdellovibrionales bacterium]|nr:hypothetical protein [Bdellovibrionales bacterium]